MKILVAGRGFIGSSVGEKLEEKHEVRYLDMENADYECDVTEEFSIDEDFDVLIHSIGLAPGFSSKEAYQQIHVEGTRNLVDGVDADKIVYISALKAGEVDHSFFQTKKEAEEIVKDSGMDYTVVRPSTVYGKGNRLLDIIRKMAFTRVFPDLKNRTQPIVKEDLVDIISETVTGFDNQVLRAAGPEKMTMGDLGKTVYRDEGYRCFLMPYPSFMLEMKIIGLSFLPPPFQKENIQILRHDNTTDENDAMGIVELEEI